MLKRVLHEPLLYFTLAAVVIFVAEGLLTLTRQGSKSHSQQASSRYS